MLSDIYNLHLLSKQVTSKLNYQKLQLNEVFNIELMFRCIKR